MLLPILGTHPTLIKTPKFFGFLVKVINNKYNIGLGQNQGFQVQI
jgi:hypothetical protein